jgi:hypothetical protein
MHARLRAETNTPHMCVCMCVYVYVYVYVLAKIEFLFKHIPSVGSRQNILETYVFGDQSLHYQLQWWNFMNMVINYWVQKSE